jgi:formimidoylglutamate deiminase
LLEYSQRLKQRQRNVLSGGEGSTGLALYRRACAGGAQALGRACGAIAVDMWADLVAVDTDAPAFAALRPEQFLDGWIFAGGDGAVTDLWSAGRHCVRGGRHVQRDAIAARFRKTMTKMTIN